MSEDTKVKRGRKPAPSKVDVVIDLLIKWQEDKYGEGANAPLLKELKKLKGA